MTDPPLQAWTRYIAIDIHKHYLMIGGIDAHKRIVLQPRKVELHRWRESAQANLLPTDAVVIEATTNAWVIYDLLVTLVGRAVVVHPAKVKLIAEARVKTDKVDVLTLAQLLRADMRERGHPEGTRCHRPTSVTCGRCSPTVGDWSRSKRLLKIGSRVCCIV
jgi:transposase